MASGTITGSTASSEWTYKIVWSESGGSDTNNTSTVTAKAYIGRSRSKSYLGGNWSMTITINGSKGSYSGNISYPTYIDAGGWLYLTERSVSVAHNADGSKTIGISGSMSSSDFTPSWCSANSSNVVLSKLDRSAPSVKLNSAVASSTTSLTLTGSSGSVTCDRWDYSIDGGAWTNYSTAATTSTSKTITGLSSSTHTVKIEARKKSNQVYGASSVVTVDLIAPVVSFDISNIAVDGAKITASSDVPCNIWEYSLDGGANWISFSTTQGTTADVTLTGLTVNTMYTVSLRARKASNNLYGAANNVSFTTLGNTKINSVTTFYPDNVNATTITFSRTNYVATYRHRLEMKNGDDVIMYLDNISYTTGTANETINVSSELRTTLLNLIPSDSKTKAITLSMTTYDSYEDGVYGTQIGPVSDATLTLGTTQENSGPILECSVIDSNSVTIALTGDNTKLIRNASTALCTLTASARNNATIKVNMINNLITTSYTYDKVAISSFVFFIRDSRGYDVTQTINPTMIEYTVPTCVSSAERVSPVSSNQIYLSFSGRYYNGYFGNTTNYNSLTVGYRFKSLDEEEYSSLSTISNSNISTTSTSYASVPSLIPSDTFDYTKAYNLRIIVSDRINTVISDIIITKGVPVFDWGENDFEFHVPVAAIDLTLSKSLMVAGIDHTITDDDYYELASLLAEPFSQYSTYEAGDFVSNNDNIYEALHDITTAGAWNRDDWSLIPAPVTPSIQTLVNTRWVMNEVLDNEAITPGTFNLYGKTGNFEFSSSVEFIYYNAYYEIYLDDEDVPWYQAKDGDTSGWGGNDHLRDVTIYGGADATNPTIIAWFESNATQIPDTQAVISLHDTQWTMNETIPDSPKTTEPTENYYLNGSFGSLAFKNEIFIDAVNGKIEISGDDGQDFVYVNGAWAQDEYRTVSITGLSSQTSLRNTSKLHIRDADLIDWFNRNGTLNT